VAKRDRHKTNDLKQTIGNTRLAIDDPFISIQIGDSDVFLSKSEPKTVHWSVPWSDIMMTMFIFFVVLYVFHASDRESIFGKETPISATLKRMDNTARMENEKIEAPPTISKVYDMSKQALEAPNSVELVKNRAVRIVLTSDLLFDTGKTDLKFEAQVILKKIAEIIRQTPYMVNVVGHTDNRPIRSDKFPSNWELSAMRACVTGRFLIEEMHIPPNQIFISGHGQYQPIKPNTDAHSRTVNRRVEIIITKNKPFDSKDFQIF
jgi:chemotaxis protein MotB